MTTGATQPTDPTRTTDPNRLTEPTQLAQLTEMPDEDEVPEGDRLEQRQSAGYVEDDVVVPPDAERAVPEASDGDLAEQAHEVPLDDEER